jgi:hypothetical protein
MSICLAAMIVFAVMGVFSAKYRRWAKEAFGCVAKRITLRSCDASLNQKIKAKITGKLINRSPGAAKFIHKHFEAVSWIFTIILFVSLFFTATSLYNLAVYGTCDPSSDVCILSPSSEVCGCEGPGCTQKIDFASHVMTGIANAQAGRLVTVDF